MKGNQGGLASGAQYKGPVHHGQEATEARAYGGAHIASSAIRTEN